MQARTCVTGGQTLPCWYIDPSRAQGANWWALDDPTGGAVASGEAPLPAPFYVVKVDGFEVRHFMALDTGYPVNLAARRILGANARPRDGEPESGLVWNESSDLCDTSRPEMGCAPSPSPAPEPAPAATDAVPPEPAPEPAPAPTPPGVPVPVIDLLRSVRLPEEDGTVAPAFPFGSAF